VYNVWIFPLKKLREEKRKNQKERGEEEGE
jgi:hypothetical protein